MATVSQLDALQAGETYSAADSDFREPDRSGVVVFRSSLPAGLYQRPAADDLAIQLQLTSGAMTRIDHGVRFACTTRTGFLALAPRGVDLSYEMAGSASFIGAVLPSTLMRSALEMGDGAPIDLGWLHHSSFADETVAALLRRLWAETPDYVPASRLLTDSIWTTVALLLQSRSQARRSDAPQPPALPACADNFSDWRLRRTLDHIEGRLGQDIGLDELAGEVRLSRRQYSAMFRASMGMSPHQWLTERRVERASQLLRLPGLSMTEIAFQCGFASPQHFSTVFRKHRRVTPTAFRRDKR